ncbi:FliH/SctL family protein [Desulfurivibrio alkaliphilus]|uniref:Flagellar assembly protein FliH n=1 Tax=Desulfurivibrio alkaliphilus (strain DSM 19089 / UNIQEM U267 / AHT2) TaxID=589865 RepID=D6Z2V9_DESAT|nr:FliH/SctL family protein [Desulfurivibrio alkaliphilus]ADH85884.1 Flagellar assembly protein FliH/Type III secretion system HrpE [Desulfurivibrio alkaliphilus AHT 2]
MSNKRKKPANDEFVELAGDQGQAPPDASEFLSFVELWQRTREKASAVKTEEGSRELAMEPEPEEPDPVEEARRQAAEIMAAAQKEAERLHQEAMEKGRAEGEKKGRAEAKKEYSARLAELKKLLAEIQLQRGAIIQRYREDLLALVQVMTDCLVHHETATNPQVIRACLQKATDFVVENSSVQAFVNPDDLRNLREAGLREPALLGGKNRIELVADPALARGGCLLKSAFGEVDATLDNSREKLYQAVSRSFQAVLAAHADEDEEPPPASEIAAVWPEDEAEESAPAAEEATAVALGEGDEAVLAADSDPAGPAASADASEQVEQDEQAAPEELPAEVAATSEAGGSKLDAAEPEPEKPSPAPEKPLTAPELQ